MNTISISKSIPQTVVAHLGARLHYGVAEVLNNQGILKRLFTDLYFGSNSISYKLINGISKYISSPHLKKALRRSSSIESEKITAFPLLGTQYWLELNRRAANTDIFLKYNRKFGTKVANHLPELTFNSVYGFSGSSLEIFLKAQELNASSFLEQMGAPVSTSQEVIQSEQQRWPGWQTHFSTLWNVDEWHARELKEWEIADHIIVPSSYVEEQLSGYNIDQTKITCIPYAVSLDQFGPKERDFKGNRKLRCLYAGDLRLLKGIPYLLGAIDNIGSNYVELACIGTNYLDSDALVPYLNKVHFTGSLPRQEVLKWYKWADVLIMPSLCEGSSTVTYEAKAMGLPIIATYNSGTWIEDGVDGFSIPTRSIAGIAEALEEFLYAPSRINQMSKAAIESRYQFGWEVYRQNLYNLIAPNQTPY